MANGIDISQFQGDVDFNQVKNSVEFVIIRAGYGGGGVDKKFQRNRDEARRYGIPRQFYFYAYPGRGSGAQQAHEFFNIVGALQKGESISLDMEDDPTYGRYLIPSDVQWALDFLNTSLELFGTKGLLYINSYLKGKFDWSPIKNADYGLWIANYGPNNGQANGDGPDPSPWDFWAIWQYTSQASAAGISPVDANIFNGTIEQFLKYGLQGSGPAPTPPPTPIPQPPSNSFTVNSPTPGYVTAADAAARKNSNSTVPAGTYSIFNQSQGMINVTRQAGVPGWWINPSDNGSQPAPGNDPVYIVVPSGPDGYLGTLSAKYGTPVDTIVAWNKPKYPSMTRDYVQAGWTIRVK